MNALILKPRVRREIQSKVDRILRELEILNRHCDWNSFANSSNWIGSPFLSLSIR